MWAVAVVTVVGLAFPALAPAPTAVATRPDGAVRLEISGLGGSLQNPCWSPTGDRLAITEWTGGYNDGPALVQVVPAAGGPAVATLGLPDTDSVNLPGSCFDRTTGAITYTADTDDGDQVFVQVPGSEAVRVTGAPVVAFEPSFSPDGTRIVFESHQNGRRGEIWVVGRDGSGLVRITSGADDRQPNWSPRGDLIAFQRSRGRGLPDLHVVRPDGTGLRNVTRTRALEETDVSFSPDGERLVFSSDGNAVGIASLFTISVDGGPRTQITRSNRHYDGAPAWSPDGSRVVFESRRGDPDGSTGTTIWTIGVPSTP